MGIIEEDTSNNETETLEIVDSKECKKIFRNRILKALAAATAALISIISNYNKKETDVLGIAVTIGSILYAGWSFKKKIEQTTAVEEEKEQSEGRGK